VAETSSDLQGKTNSSLTHILTLSSASEAQGWFLTAVDTFWGRGENCRRLQEFSLSREIGHCLTFI
jgi:hypothetical protein